MRRALFALTLLAPLAATAQSQTPHTFAVQGDHFTLDGKPFQVISGAIHYTRIPRAYWRDRLKKAKAMGLNTVETYAFWNAHEPTPGHFDFTGQNDIAEFVREAQQEGLYVILRPGPYACAEWEFGGYPAWLLKDPNMKVRSPYPGFMNPTRTYLKALGKQLAPLQIENGGPIIAVQVENEYGSYGSDHTYMELIHKAVLDAGFDKALLYTADGGDMLAAGTLPELPAAVNFGVGDAKRSFGLYDKFRPNSIHFNSEYWDGWFDHWGHKHETRSTEQQVEDLRWMLSHGYSVNLYMFDGGTSFGWMNGANSVKGDYEPDVTSYDYDVPVAESGALRPKFWEFRKVITEVTHQTPPQPPADPVAIAVPSIQLDAATSLWDHLPKPVKSDTPQTMEALGQAYGYILYTITLTGAGQKLSLPGLHSYAQVYLNGAFQGTVDRRLDQKDLALKQPAKSGDKLSILVENTGRVNYGPAITGEHAGLLQSPTLDGTTLHSWLNYTLPMEHPETLPYTQKPCEGPCFYRSTFTVTTPADTFLDIGKLSKGFVWVNGHALGRVWSIGPQQTLFLPGPWLKSGENQIVVFDLSGKPGLSIEGLAKPILDAPVHE